MSTTTIRLPERLKARVARAAKRAGTSSHNFILQAIAEKAEQEERRNEFHAEAERRYASIAVTGETLAWNDVRSYLERRVSGKHAARPTSSKLAR